MSGIKDKSLALWGVASASAQCDKFDDSITAYKQLIVDFPKNITYKFEFMQILLSDERLNEAIKEFQDIVELTTRYDYFYKIFAKIYFQRGIWESSLGCIDEYLKKFNFDIEGLKLKKDLIVRLNRTHELERIENKIKKLNWS